MDSNKLLNAGGKERALRVGRKCVAVFDLSDYAVKGDLVIGKHNHDVAGAVFLLVDRKLDDGRVAVVLCNGFVFEIGGVKTDGLAK